MVMIQWLMRLQRQSSLARFAAVGALGYVIDTSVLYLSVYALSAGPYRGRIVSYLTSATITWYLNRQYTFPHARGVHLGRQWLAFVSCSVLAGGLNYLAYALFLRLAGQSPLTLMIGVGVGACAGLSVNYTLSRQLVFRQRRAARADAPAA